MKNEDDASGGIRIHLDAKQCELLIGRACSADKAPAHPPQNPEATVSRSKRDSLTEAMIGLILGPDAF